MPVTLSFKLEQTTAHEQAELSSVFERFGCESLDTTTFRYPALATGNEPSTPEDWFNHVVPALMLFRSYVLAQRLIVKTFTLDAHSSTGYRCGAEIGSPPLRAENIRLRAAPTGKQSPDRTDAAEEEQRWSALEDWLDASDFPLSHIN
ncbi:MAG TPA: hypothetical protein VFI31_15600 [Pirellulales bacterium]|nr:hypothetical protein [Pirellulales bacterium]